MENKTWPESMGIRERAFTVWVVVQAGKDMESAKLYGYNPSKDLITSPNGIIRKVSFEASESLKRASTVLSERLKKKISSEEIAKFCET